MEKLKPVIMLWACAAIILALVGITGQYGPHYNTREIPARLCFSCHQPQIITRWPTAYKLSGTFRCGCMAVPTSLSCSLSRSRQTCLVFLLIAMKSCRSVGEGVGLISPGKRRMAHDCRWRMCACNAGSLEIVWRLSYALILVLISFMVLWRIFKVKESAQWKKRAHGVLPRAHARAGSKLMSLWPVHDAPVRLLPAALAYVGEHQCQAVPLEEREKGDA